MEATFKMEQDLKVWIDGKLYGRDDAKISVFDHCVLYGDGVFEGIRLYSGCIFRLQEHLERLWSSARFTRLQIPMSMEEMIGALKETVKANRLKDGYIRLVVTRGVGDLGLDPTLCPKATVFIIAANIKMYPKSDYDNGLEIVTVPTNRVNVSAFNPRVKSCNYLNNIMGKMEGQLAGVREALMLDANGFVVECTGDNVFIVKNGVITTPPVYLGALRGITRDAVIEIAKADGREVREEPFTRFEVYDADEVFLTGTAAEAIPVTKVDGRQIGSGKPGDVTRDLIQKFREIVCKDGVMVD
jgi:branched-chain amino acid aminotransferase